MLTELLMTLDAKITEIQSRISGIEQAQLWASSDFANYGENLKFKAVTEGKTKKKRRKLVNVIVSKQFSFLALYNSIRELPHRLHVSKEQDYLEYGKVRANIQKEYWRCHRELQAILKKQDICYKAGRVITTTLSEIENPAPQDLTVMSAPAIAQYYKWQKELATLKEKYHLVEERESARDIVNDGFAPHL